MAHMERPEGSAVSLKRHDLLPSDSSEPQPEHDDTYGSKGNFGHPITISSRGPSAEVQFAEEDFNDVNGQYAQHGPVDDFAEEDQLDGYAEQPMPYDVDPAGWQQQQQHTAQNEYADHAPQDIAELQPAGHFDHQKLNESARAATQQPGQYNYQHLVPEHDDRWSRQSRVEEKSKEKHQGKKGKKKHLHPREQETGLGDPRHANVRPQYSVNGGLTDRGRPRSIAPPLFTRSNDISGTRNSFTGYKSRELGIDRSAQPKRSAFVPEQLATPDTSSRHPPPPSLLRYTSDPATKAKKSARGSRSALPAKRKADEISETNSILGFDQDTHDLVANFAQAINRSSKAKLKELSRDNEKLQDDLQQAQNEQQVLQSQIGSLQQEKLDISEVVAKQKAKISAFEVRAGKFKTYIEGLGHDLNALRRQGNDDHRRGEELADETRINHGLLDDLTKRLSTDSEEAARIRAQALKALHDASSELKAVKARCAHLEERANTCSNLLAEEKALRSQLQSQLTSSNNAKEAVLEEIKSNNASVLNKLSAIQEDLAKTESHEKVVKMLENALTTVQDLSTQQESATTNINSVKEAVDALGESFATISNNDTADEGIASLKSHLDQALNGLKSDLCEYEKLAAEEASNRETIVDLKGKLSASESTISSLNEQLSTANASANANQDYQAKLHDLELDLQVKSSELESVQAELASKIPEIAKLTSVNQTLQQQADEASANASEEQFEAAKAEARAEMSAHVERLRGEIESNSLNKLKSVSKERDKAQSRSKELQSELTAAKAELQSLKEDDSTSHIQEDLATAQDLAEKRKEDIASLQQELVQANEKARVNREAQAALIAQVETEQHNVQDLQEQLRAAEEAQVEAETARDNARSERDESVTNYRAQADAAILEVRQQSDKRVEDLQTALTESREECQRKDAEAEEFRVSIESQLKAEDESHSKNIEELKTKLAEAERSRDEALAACKRLQDGLSKASTLTESVRQTTNGTRESLKQTESAQAGLAAKTSRGPVVEESQTMERFDFENIQSSAPKFQPTRGPVVEESQQAFASMPKPPAPRFPDDDPFGTNEDTQETQQDDSYVDSQQNSFPSFAAFNNRRARQTKLPSSDYSTQDISNPYTWNKSASQTRVNPSSGNQGTLDAYHSLHSQIEEYRKPTPVPNSGSKLMRAASEVSHVSGGESSRAKLQTPDPRTVAGLKGQQSPSKSSTPDFISRSQNRPKHTYGHGSGQGKHHNSSRRASDASREQTPTAAKRKAGGQVIAGYEPERKKRLTTSNAASKPANFQGGAAGPSSSRGMEQPSQGSSQASRVQPAGRGAGQSSARSQKTASGPTRMTRSSKGKKNDQYNSRFQQELGRR